MMKLRISILFIIYAFIVTMAIGQSEVNPRLLKKNGIILSGGGPGLYGSLSYDYFVKPDFNVEVGAGPFTVFGGVKYHLDGYKNKRWTPYIGGYAMYIWIFEVFADDDNESPLAVYIPAGIHYIGENGFSFALEIAGMQGFGEFIEFGALKFGYRF